MAHAVDLRGQTLKRGRLFLFNVSPAAGRVHGIRPSELDEARRAFVHLLEVGRKIAA